MDQVMNVKKSRYSVFQHKMYLMLLASLLGLAGCGSSDDGGDTGHLQFYNASKNAPAVFLTIDEDLEEDDDDEVEITYAGVNYGYATSLKEVEDQSYFYELAWQDEDSQDRDDLELIFESQLTVTKDNIQFIVLSEDITTPHVEVYDIPVVDDDDDATDDLFNVRFLNMHPDSEGIDVYMSDANETFNEAILVGQYAYKGLSDNFKFDQDEYLFYITKAGTTEVLYQSSEVDYGYPSQYVMVVRENSGTGTSPYAIDRVSTSATTEYLDFNSQAQFKVYNAIQTHELIPDYQNSVDVYVDGDGEDEQADITDLAKGHFSDTIIRNHGDYSLDVLVAGTDEKLLKNHLLTLAENSNKSVFVYLEEKDVDHDGDGDVDEDGDGIVDEIEVTLHSLVVNNSVRESIYDHDISMVNLVDSDDFSLVNFYFVRSDETIETANYTKTVGYTAAESITLLNNTYQVFAVAEENSSDMIIATTELILNEDSNNLHMIIETDESSATGYALTIANQVTEAQ